MLIRMLAGSLLLAAASSAEPHTVQDEESLFAVVTQRAGIAARFAHDHIIAANDYDVTLETQEGDVSDFSFTCLAKDLQVDAPNIADQWNSKLLAAKLLPSEPKDISESDRATVREHMLAEDQLDATAFPEINAKLVSISENASEFRGIQYTHSAELELTVREISVTRTVAATITVTSGALTVEAAGAFNFTDFDIEPYSAMMGAVRNQDEFFVYCYLSAARTE